MLEVTAENVWLTLWTTAEIKFRPVFWLIAVFHNLSISGSFPSVQQLGIPGSSTSLRALHILFSKNYCKWYSIPQVAKIFQRVPWLKWSRQFQGGRSHLTLPHFAYKSLGHKPYCPIHIPHKFWVRDQPILVVWPWGEFLGCGTSSANNLKSQAYQEELVSPSKSRSTNRKEYH